MTEYLTLIEVLEIHSVLLKAKGGTQGVRDYGLIEAALFRPQTGYYSDLIQEAAALWESFSQNHPFIDGNKRVAFGVADTFLRANGFSLKVTSDEVYEFVMPLYESGEFNFQNLERWLRERAKRIG